jgi:hypothetical protein
MQPKHTIAIVTVIILAVIVVTIIAVVSKPAHCTPTTATPPPPTQSLPTTTTTPVSVAVQPANCTPTTETPPPPTQSLPTTATEPVRVAVLIPGRVTCINTCLKPQVQQYLETHPGDTVHVFISTNQPPGPLGWEEGEGVWCRAMIFTRVEQCVVPPNLKEAPKREETNVYNTVSMFFHVQRAYEMLFTSGYRYDVVLRFRPDIVSNCLPDIQATLPLTNHSVVHVPAGYDYCGINDQVAWGSVQAMGRYSYVYSAIVKDWYENQKLRCVFNPEVLLLTYGQEIQGIEWSRPVGYQYSLHPQRHG